MRQVAPGPSGLVEFRTAVMGLVALGVGLLVYLVDRPAGGLLFGSAGAWLPSLLHTLGFGLISAAALPAARHGRACAAWLLANAAFEIGQHPRFAGTLSEALQAVPSLGAYFAHGHFDPADLLAAGAGAGLAAVLLGATARPWKAGARPRRWLLGGIGAAGLVGIVGSGGGGLGSICDTYPDSCKPPTLLVVVEPAKASAPVGGSVSFDAVSNYETVELSYQWQRSDDGGARFADIAQATGARLTLSAVTLADDGALLRAVVRSADGQTAQAVASLAVLSVSPVDMADGDFDPAQWSVGPYLPPGATAFSPQSERLPSGGADGAYQRTDLTVPADTGSVRVLHLSSAVVYDPALQGEIHSIDHTFACAGLVRGTATAIQLRLLVEQGGQRFAGPAPDVVCHDADWSNTPRQTGLRAADFALLDGTACSAGGGCPDFSAGAAPLRFGLLAVITSYPAEAAAYGIDSWQLRIWRR